MTDETKACMQRERGGVQEKEGVKRGGGREIVVIFYFTNLSKIPRITQLQYSKAPPKSKFVN